MIRNFQTIPNMLSELYESYNLKTKARINLETPTPVTYHSSKFQG